MLQFKRSSLDEFPDDWKLKEGEGDIKRGAKLFKKHCIQCHSIYPDNRTQRGSMAYGPTLWDICGRVCGAQDIAGHTALSFAGRGIVWNDVNLMKYMKNPYQMVDYAQLGMNFYGIDDVQKRKDILAYLHTLNKNHPNGQALFNEKFTNTSNVFSRLFGK